MLSSGSGDQSYSPLIVLLWRWLFNVLIYWGLGFLPHPFSVGQGQCSVSLTLLSVCYDGSLFNFLWQFDFGCFLMAQEMSFVIHNLPCLREWLITCCCQPSCLSRLCLLIVLLRSAPSSSPFLQWTFSDPTSSAVC
jgi:hypothetical protein